MSKTIEIFRLTQVLTEEGYTETGILNLLDVLTGIQSEGYYKTPKGAVIGATGIEPYFKLNNKSVRVYLHTKHVRNCLILNHPSMSEGFMNGHTANAVHAGSRKYFEASWNNREILPDLIRLSKFVVAFE